METILAIAALTGCLITTVGALFGNDNTIKKAFDDVLKNVSGNKVLNKNNETFELFNIFKTDYGYKAKASIPNGLAVENFKQVVPMLQDRLGCKIKIEKDEFENYMDLEITTRDVVNYDYVAIKQNKYQFYMGKDSSGKDVFLNFIDSPHLLIGGATTTGKSRLMFLGLTNLIYNCCDEIDIYLMQLEKKDLFKFKDLRCTKMAARTIHECCVILDMLENTRKKREEIFEKSGVENILEYNKKFPKKQMKPIYLIADEFSMFYPDLNDGEEVSALKKVANIMLTKLSKLSRSAGINIIAGIQRATVDNITPTLKACLSRATMRMKSAIDSLTIIGIADAVDLKQRECILDDNCSIRKFKVCNIEKEAIDKYLISFRLKQNEENKKNTNVVAMELSKVVFEKATEKDIEEFKMKKLKKKNKQNEVAASKEVRSTRKNSRVRGD